MTKVEPLTTKFNPTKIEAGWSDTHDYVSLTTSQFNKRFFARLASSPLVALTELIDFFPKLTGLTVVAATSSLMRYSINTIPYIGSDGTQTSLTNKAAEYTGHFIMDQGLSHGQSLLSGAFSAAYNRLTPQHMPRILPKNPGVSDKLIEAAYAFDKRVHDDELATRAVHTPAHSPILTHLMPVFVLTATLGVAAYAYQHFTQKKDASPADQTENKATEAE